MTSPHRHPTVMRRFGVASVAWALLFGSSLAVAQTTDENNSANSTDVLKLEDFPVTTGSRLNPPDFEGALPVTVYTSETLSRLPVMTINNFLRTTPMAFGSGNIDESFVNGGTGRAFIGLRGLPTLTLVNGRRTTTGDLNAVPLAAVERIEILKDGNGAVYGADAVGGVINIITKRNFEGLQLDASYQNTTDKDISRRRFEAVWGKTYERGSLTMGISYFKQNNLYSRDRDFITETSDRSFGATSATPSPARFTLTPAQALSLLGIAGQVGNITYRVRNDLTAATGPSSFRVGQYGLGPVETSDRFPFALYTPAVRPAERYNTFMSADYKLFKDSEAAVLYTDIFYMRSYSQAELAPSPAGFAATSNPATDFRIPANYYWMQQVFPGTTTDITSWQNRFLELGSRQNDVSFNDFALTLGLKGDINDRLSYDVSWYWNRNEQLDTERNGVNRDRLRQMLQGTAPAQFLGANSWNPFANFFDSGVNSQNQATLDWLKLEPRTFRDFTTEVFNAQLKFKPFDAPAGTVETIVGVENRNERFKRTPDLAKQQAAGSGWNAISAFSQDFSIRSIFAEAVVPLLKDAPFARNLALGLAARREEFSHLPDEPTILRAYLRNQVNRDLTLRLAYSEGYTAPTPGALDPSSAQAFPNVYMPWLNATDQTAQGVLLVGNANLKPTESKSINFGAVWSPRAVKGLSVQLDFYSIEQTNIIVQDPQVYVDAFAANGGVSPGPGGTFVKNNNAPFANRIILDGDGAVTGIPGYIVTIAPVNTENIAALEAKAIDLEVTYAHETSDWGKFTYRLNLTHTLDFKIEKIPGLLTSEYVDLYTPNDAIGPESAPSWKGFLQADWDFRDLFATLKFNWVNSYNEDPNGGQVFNSQLKAFRTIDLTVGYTFPRTGTTIRFGVENLLDTYPSKAESSFADKYDRSMSNILGRMFNVALTQKF